MTLDRTRTSGDGRSERAAAGPQDEGARPYPSRPYPSRPYPSRPYPSRPYPSRPYPSRPYPSRSDEGEPDGFGGFLNPEDWSGDVGELFCARSTVVRLGAQLVFGDGDLDVPSVVPRAAAPAPDYLPQPRLTTRRAPAVPMISAPKPESDISATRLRPRDYELAWELVLPNRVARDVAEHPDLGWALKRDLAEGLARRADQAFLNGAPNAPLGVANVIAPAPLPAGFLLWGLRSIVDQVRRRPDAVFGSAGWVIHPQTLADLSLLTSVDFRSAPPPPPPPPAAEESTLDSTRLLTYDGRDGGTLLGYPFLVSEAASPAPGRRNIVFSSDWSEAWIGIDRELVTIDISTEANFGNDETVVRAVMHHDWVLRRPGFFIYAPQP
jgi:hypothetical protein